MAYKEKASKIRKQVLEDFYSGVTLHGFRFLFEGSVIRRIVWFCITTTVFTMSVLLFIDLVLDYLKRESLTTLSTTKLKGEIEFPTITFCPSVAESAEKLKNLPGNLTDDEFFSIETEIFNEAVSNKSLEYLKTHRLMKFSDWLKTYAFSSIDDYTDSNILSAFWKNCHYYDKECNKTDFKFTVLDDKACLQFNPFIPNKNGMTVPKDALFRESFSFMFDLGKQSLKWSLTNFADVDVIVSKYGYHHYSHGDSDIVSVQPGEYKFMRLSRKQTNKLPPPFKSHCGSKPLEFVRNRTYTKKFCWLDCLIKEVYDKVGCVGPNLQDLTDIEECGMELAGKAMNLEYDLFHGEFITKCRNNCPDECVKNTYDISLNSARLGNGGIYTYILDTVDDWRNKTTAELEEYIRRNMFGVSISFLDTEIFEETMVQAVTFTTLIGTIGGSVGLGLGFSFITGFEFIFFIYDYITMPWRKDKPTAEEKETKNARTIAYLSS